MTLKGICDCPAASALIYVGWYLEIVPPGMAASVGLGLRAFVQQTFAKNGFTTLLNQR